MVQRWQNAKVILMYIIWAYEGPRFACLGYWGCAVFRGSKRQFGDYQLYSTYRRMMATISSKKKKKKKRGEEKKKKKKTRTAYMYVTALALTANPPDN